MPERKDGIRRNLTEKDLELSGMFFRECLRRDIPFTLEFDTGRYIPGEHTMRDGHLIPEDEIAKEHIIQGRPGFRVEVGGRSFINNDTDREELYTSVGDAAISGLRIISLIDRERSS